VSPVKSGRVPFQVSGRGKGMQYDGPDAVNDGGPAAAWLDRVDEPDKGREVQMRLDKLRQWRLVSRSTGRVVLLLLPGRYVPLCTRAGWCTMTSAVSKQWVDRVLDAGERAETGSEERNNATNQAGRRRGVVRIAR